EALGQGLGRVVEWHDEHAVLDRTPIGFIHGWFTLYVVRLRASPEKGTRLLHCRSRVPFSGEALIKGDGPARSSVTAANLYCRKEEVCVGRQLAGPGQILHAGHALAAQGPVRHQRPPRLAASQGGPVRGHAANSPFGKVFNGIRTRSRPAFAFAV